MGMAGCTSMRKQELGRESSRRVIGWHSSGGVFIVRAAQVVSL